MADSLLAGLLRLNALHPPRADRAAANPARARIVDAKPRQRDQASLVLPGVAPGYFDRKRAAAGDTD